MRKLSAGILLFRRLGNELKVLLVHPGGPFWAKKDLSAWSIPKGEYSEGEDAFDAAQREFQEETGVRVDGAFLELGELRQPSGKIVRVWALERELDATAIRSNTFELEWPAKSGKKRTYPEVDRAEWFPLALAHEKILAGQRPFLDRLKERLRL